MPRRKLFSLFDQNNFGNETFSASKIAFILVFFPTQRSQLMSGLVVTVQITSSKTGEQLKYRKNSTNFGCCCVTVKTEKSNIYENRSSTVSKGYLIWKRI